MTAPVALTCGEPAGIGAEIALKARAARPDLPFFWIGDPAHLPPGSFAEIAAPDGAASVPPGRLPVLPHPFPTPAVPGRPDPRHAQAVIDVIARAVALVQAGAASAICTLPIHKKALIDGAGFPHPGHTEFLAALAGPGTRAVMMLACDALRVVPATIHIPLAAVPAALTPALLEETLRITHAALIRDFALPAPRIAVAGLNPHAGEGGAMGTEEATVIAPVLDRLRAEGMALRGPLPADTLFHPGARTRYDAAVCMYHDQALIPIKTIDFAGGVNVTLGLPFVRTAPDHGTAFDIAGKGQADPTSLIAALDMARSLAANRA
jgi:4-hydroxythreonine-4-phosphate dehydrogenase